MRVHLKPAFGTTKLDAIGVEQIERYKAAKRKDGLAAKTINNHLTVLRKLLVVARDWGRVRMVPAIHGCAWRRLSSGSSRSRKRTGCCAAPIPSGGAGEGNRAR